LLIVYLNPQKATLRGQKYELFLKRIDPLSEDFAKFADAAIAYVFGAL
jgi:hypothetical protein